MKTFETYLPEAFGDKSLLYIQTEKFEQELHDNYPIELHIYYSDISHSIILSKIVVDKNTRERGIGSNVMNLICDFADKHKMKILLTPSNDFGGSKVRLVNFYKRFGFIKNKDFVHRETMVREPK